VKNRWIQLGVVIGAGLIVAIVALSLTVWSPPGRKDFKQAQTAVNALDEKFDKVSLAAMAYTSTSKAGPDAAAANAKKAYQKSVDGLMTSLKDIGAMKALRESTVRTAYDALRRKIDKFIAYTNGFTNMSLSFEACTGVLQVIRDKNVAKAHRAAAKDCLAQLDKLAKSDVAPIADYAHKYADAVRTRQKIFDSYAKSGIPTNKAINDLKKANARLVDSLDLNALQKARNDSSPLSEYKKLKQTLEQQLKQAS
jgi:uncharacterized protein YggL (DUF469 family)